MKYNICLGEKNKKNYPAQIMQISCADLLSSANLFGRILKCIRVTHTQDNTCAAARLICERP